MSKIRKSTKEAKKEAAQTAKEKRTAKRNKKQPPESLIKPTHPTS
jgi:hypothetical protein